MPARYAIIRQEPQSCHACAHPTIFACMTCARPTCTPCSFSMTAQCKDCRASYHGPIHELGKQADRYMWAEFDRIFAA